ncbi:bacteriocin [Staphylococcus hominis]|nr:bacteriocin [Staphylococcus hominis]MDS3909633.1 bacteriocin [Staphylococcus hominis]
MKTLNEKELKQVNGGMWTAEETGRKIGNVARQAARQDYPVFDSPFKS